MVSAPQMVLLLALGHFVLLLVFVSHRTYFNMNQVFPKVNSWSHTSAWLSLPLKTLPISHIMPDLPLSSVTNPLTGSCPTLVHERSFKAYCKSSSWP